MPRNLVNNNLYPWLIRCQESKSLTGAPEIFLFGMLLLTVHGLGHQAAWRREVWIVWSEHQDDGSFI